MNIHVSDRIDSLRSEVSEVSDGGQLLEDALEESFNQLEDNKKLLFRYCSILKRSFIREFLS